MALVDRRELIKMWTSLLMMIFGLWLIAQALIGDLSGRLLSWGKGL